MYIFSGPIYLLEVVHAGFKEKERERELRKTKKEESGRERVKENVHSDSLKAKKWSPVWCSLRPQICQSRARHPS